MRRILVAAFVVTAIVAIPWAGIGASVGARPIGPSTIVGLDPETGADRWRTQVGNGRVFVTAEYAIGDLVYVEYASCGAAASSVFAAYDTRDGKERWRTRVEGTHVTPGPDMSGTISYERTYGVSNRAIVVRGRGSLRGLDPHSGAMKWTLPLAGRKVLGGSRDLVLIGDGFGVQPTITAYRKTDGRRAWIFDDVPAGWFAYVVGVGADLVVVLTFPPPGMRDTSDISIRGLDATDGSEQWRVGEPLPGYNAVVFDDAVVINDASGRTHGLSAVTGIELWSRTASLAGAQSPRSPLLLAPPDEGIERIDPASGRLVWASQAPFEQFPLASSGQMMLFHSESVPSTQVISIASATGQQRWQRQMRPNSNTYVIGERAIVAAESGCALRDDE